jgi:hypothetical protein
MGEEYPHIAALRIISLFIFGGCVFGLGLMGFFIYSTVYQTLEDAHSIIIFRSELGIDELHVAELESVHTLWKEKIESYPAELTENPFIETPIIIPSSTP